MGEEQHSQREWGEREENTTETCGKPGENTAMGVK